MVYNVYRCTLFLLNAEVEQAKSVKKLDDFHRKKHFVRFFW